jgi:hypothetical protein
MISLDGHRSADGTAQGHTELPEYEAALKARHVVFEQLVIARHALCIHARHVGNLEKVAKDDVRWTYAHYLPKLWQMYEKTEGKIIEYYFCHQTLAGAILKKKGDLVVRYLPQDVAHVTPGFEHTLWQCTIQARLANELLLRHGGRMVLLRRLFSLIVYLLTVLDSQNLHKRPEGLEKPEAERITIALSAADAELKRTGIELKRLAGRDAQLIYLLGMVPSIALLGAVSYWTAGISNSIIDPFSLLVALVSGGLGATVSVMNRASGGKLELDYHAGWALTVISGFFRPVLGAIFGLAVYVFLNAGLAQISSNLPNSQGNDTKHIFFFSAVAFLSGFSERWAKDVLSLSLPNKGETDDRHTASSTSPGAS